MSVEQDVMELSRKFHDWSDKTNSDSASEAYAECGNTLDDYIAGLPTDPWTKIEDGLPKIGQVVALVSVDRYWATGDDLSFPYVTAIGSLQELSNPSVYWAIPGEPSAALGTFTHWMPLTPPTTV